MHAHVQSYRVGARGQIAVLSGTQLVATRVRGVQEACKFEKQSSGR